MQRKYSTHDSILNSRNLKTQHYQPAYATGLTYKHSQTFNHPSSPDFAQRTPGKRTEYYLRFSRKQSGLLLMPHEFYIFLTNLINNSEPVLSE